MRKVETRLNQIEKQIGQADCICCDPDNSNLSIVVIKGDWRSDEIERAEALKRFTCPIHGVRLPSILRLSESDANL